MAVNEHYAVVHDTSVTGLRTQANFVRRNAEPVAAPMATLCDKRGARHTLEIQVTTNGNGAAARTRVHNAPSLDGLLDLISNGRDALELNGASPVRVNFSEEDYDSLIARISSQQKTASDRIEKIWLASVRVEKSARTTAGRLQLIGADGSILNLNWSGGATLREAAALPSTIHPVDFSSPRG